jgi:hypothetical protein
MRSVWRVAAGGQGRDLTDYFLEHGVALIGPGWGDWFDVRYEGYGSESKFVRPFAEAESGDILLLMLGFSIVAVGVIEGEYRYWPEAGYLQGWDLHHQRRVRWARVEQIKPPPPQRYAVVGRASAVGDEAVVRWARKAAATADRLGLFVDKLPELPADEKRLPKSKYPVRLRNVIQRAEALRRVISEERDWEWPSEAEVKALLVVPLLLDCGVGPENIALEWRRIDVAVFRGSARREEDCVLLVEAKRPPRGLTHARYQGEAYGAAHKLEVPVVTTDGFVWSLFRDPDDPHPLHADLPRLTTSAEAFFDALIAQLTL